MIYNVILVSYVQQGELVIKKSGFMYPLFKFLFYILKKLTGEKFLYNIVLVSARK